MVDTVPPPSLPDYDIEFFWDPVCPFSWITSRWVAEVARQKEFKVDWRFISLRLVNKDKNYETDFPPGYEEGHTNGLRVLRVAAAVRAEVGRDALGPFVAAFGHAYWDEPKGSDVRAKIATADHVAGVLTKVGLPTHFTAALDDNSWDEMLDAEGEMALARTGRDVGTPIITHIPPDGLSFFGPVISNVPPPEKAVPLWDAVTTLATFDGFAELKRSLRDRPQLNLLGGVSATPVKEDWKGGHRV
jgi:2-hydroxychromene-2-carboxylate isomerase